MKRIVTHLVFLVLALFIAQFALGRYPLLDNRLALGIELFLFILSAISLSVWVTKSRRNGGGQRSRSAFFAFSLALGTFGILLLINGGLDRSPASKVSATVLQKLVVRGRHNVVQYRLYVSSWRPGNSHEDLSVKITVFDEAVVGKTVTVVTRSGFFHLPWYADVYPAAM
jgi:hypothetical protein